GGRMHLQVAADVLDLDEARQTMLAGERDLATRFAQLRRHPVEAERVVDLLFGLARDPPRALEQSVLVELVPLLLGDLAELDVVRLGSREILQGGGVGGGLYGAQVRLQPA